MSFMVSNPAYLSHSLHNESLTAHYLTILFHSQYGSATKATREVPVIKYAKKLSNQVLSQLKYLRDGSYFNGETHTLRTSSDFKEGSEKRYFIEATDSEGNVIKDREGNDIEHENIANMYFRNHLAA